MRCNSDQLEKDTTPKVENAKESIQNGINFLDKAKTQIDAYDSAAAEINTVIERASIHIQTLENLEKKINNKVNSFRKVETFTNSMANAFSDGFKNEWNRLEGYQQSDSKKRPYIQKNAKFAAITYDEYKSNAKVALRALNDDEEVSEEDMQMKTMAKFGAYVAKWTYGTKNEVEDAVSSVTEKIKKYLPFGKTEGIEETIEPENGAVNAETNNYSNTNTTVTDDRSGVSNPTDNIPEEVNPDDSRVDETITTPDSTELDFDEKLANAKEKIKNYFLNNKDYGITEDKLNEIFGNMIVCNSDELFNEFAKKFGYTNCENVNAITYKNGEIIIFRPGADEIDIIRETIYSLGDMSGKVDKIKDNTVTDTTKTEQIMENKETGLLEEKTDTRGINIATAEKIALEINGESNDFKSPYSNSAKYIKEITELLDESADIKDFNIKDNSEENTKAVEIEKNTNENLNDKLRDSIDSKSEQVSKSEKIEDENQYKELDKKSYFSSEKNSFGERLNEITGQKDFYQRLVDNMNIADGYGPEKDQDKIKAANIEIEEQITYLKEKIKNASSSQEA